MKVDSQKNQLIAKLSKLPRGQRDTPEARAMRIQLRGMGYYLSKVGTEKVSDESKKKKKTVKRK